MFGAALAFQDFVFECLLVKVLGDLGSLTNLSLAQNNLDNHAWVSALCQVPCQSVDLCALLCRAEFCVFQFVCVCVFLGLLGLALVQVLEMTGTTGRRLTWINLQKTQMGEKGAVALAQVRHLVMFGA